MTLEFGEWPVWAGALLIFFSRVTDVTLGTLRIAFISRGEKSLAPLIAFFEMMIWLFAIGALVQDLTNLAYYIAYAGGFATGVFTGLRIEDRLALGSRMIRTITQHDATELSEALRAAGWGVTSVRAAGHSGEVNLIFSVIKRADVGQYMAMVEQHHPDSFSSIEEVRSIRRGVYRGSKPPLGFGGRGSFLLWKR
ncbi:MAG TPA: DUF2179 domain-containing protein [Longimicrobiales bacterium]|nr:DUF2179 domain-containing protein [Longimicrobiales bacterium]